MKTATCLLMLLACLGPVWAGPADSPRGAGPPAPPPAGLNPKLQAPINSWDEAVPLGNGLLGGLLWGQDNLLRLSLDRGDLWDERPATGIRLEEFNWPNIIQLVRAGKAGEANRIMDHPYSQPHPTKLPGGRLEIELPAGTKLTAFELDLATAQGYAWLADGNKAEVFFSAVKPVALLRIPGPEVKGLKLVTPFGQAQTGDSGPNSAAARALGYPAAKFSSEGAASWYVQEAAEGLSYCVCAGSKRAADHTLLAVTVTSTADGPGFVDLAKRRVAEALAAGYAAMLEPHVAWWKAFWAKSSVTLPETEYAILRQYYLVRYFYGAASRKGAPPMPLQGVWTADNGGLPPWKGDYHNDLNTQMTYIAYYGAGHFDEGACFLDYLWERLPVWRKFAKDFYAAPGAAIPGVMSLAGRALGGWGQYSLSPTMGAWNAQLFYLHWLYTGDATFLRERAYPWCSEIGQCLLALLQPGPDGRLVLPLSNSPEIHDNSAAAWLIPNSNYDLACMKMLFLSLAEMAQAAGSPRGAGKGDQSARWKKAADDLGDFYVNDKDVLRLDRQQDLRESHRHLSNIMAIFPFNLLNVEGGERDRRIIAASTQQWDSLGTKAWCGYSFSWMACLRARAGDAEAALKNLDIYVKAFILRNGFHANGDQTRSGYSNFTYRPFTLEGNFLAMQALHEMLLQSWSPTPGVGDSGVIRIFPAMPQRLAQAEFRDLRAEGGHCVSARREGGATVWFKVTAGRDGVVRIADNFAGRTPKWKGPAPKKVGQRFEIELKKGQAIEAELGEK